MNMLRKKLSWFFFMIKYKLGLARPGIDFIDVGQDDDPYIPVPILTSDKEV